MLQTQRYALALLVSGLLVGPFGCNDSRSFSVGVRFPDERARQQTIELRVGAIEPEADAGCEALLDGSADPGDPTYPIEDSVRFPKDTPEQARPLEEIGPGRRLFFAEGFDADAGLLLRGCSEIEAGGDGPSRVSIDLQWMETCQPTNGGVETCDGLDNDCDGNQDDGDPVFLCPGVPRAIASVCEAGRCEYLCDEGWIDANDDRSDGCECRPTRDGQEWCDGLDNDCDGVIDGPACTACAQDADCDAPSSCLGGICDSGSCVVSYSPDGVDCDDASSCTEGDSCQDG